jgi:hypothetical protein
MHNDVLHHAQHVVSINPAKLNPSTAARQPRDSSGAAGHDLFGR